MYKITPPPTTLLTLLDSPVVSSISTIASPWAEVVPFLIFPFSIIYISLSFLSLFTSASHYHSLSPLPLIKIFCFFSLFSSQIQSFFTGTHSSSETDFYFL